MRKTDVSIVILNYNTRLLLRNCLISVFKYIDEAKIEVIVVDNASSDGSVEMVKKEFPRVKLIKSDVNLGFAIGNNLAKKMTKGEYVLFLNSDTEVEKHTFKYTLNKIKSDKKIGALGCKVLLPNGQLDKDARRSFPTPWVAFTHFSGLDRMFPRSKIFAKYWYGYLSPDKTHEVDVLQGAYMLCQKNVLDMVGWFDEDYFLDGEDIDLCWKIKKTGYKLIYFPKVSILHIKKASKKSPGKSERKKIVESSVKSMELFYKKRMSKEYPKIVTAIVILGIKFMTIIRGAKVRI